MSHQSLHSLIAREHAADLARAAGANLRRAAAASPARPGVVRALRLPRPGARRATAAPQAFRAEPSVTIRYGFPDDAGALERLAKLDSSVVPTGQLLVAEVEGELWAALSLAGGGAIADPFRRTAPLLDLLGARAEQLCVPAPQRTASSGAWSGDLRRQRVRTRSDM